MNNVDFSQTSYILQNLDIAVPKYEDDKTFILNARNEISDVVCNQVVFYCYCALHAILHFPPQLHISVLIVGDGFIGNKIIKRLLELECDSLLKIYSRGDLGCLEWQKKGIKSECSLTLLLKDTPKPDIVIACTENASFPAVCKLISRIISKSTFLITPTFGLQRKKVYTNLKFPTIFRTYVEPYQTTKKLKSDLMSKISNSNSNDMNNNLKEAKKNEDGKYSSDNSKDIIIQESANVLSKRTIDIKNLIYLVENFCSLRGLPELECRKIALKSVLGYDWDYNEQISKRTEVENNVNNNIQSNSTQISEDKSDRKFSVLEDSTSLVSKEMKNNSNYYTNKYEYIMKQKMKKTIEKITNLMHLKIVSIFQKEFSSFITIEEIFSLTDRYLETFLAKQHEKNEYLKKLKMQTDKHHHHLQHHHHHRKMSIESIMHNDDVVNNVANNSKQPSLAVDNEKHEFGQALYDEETILKIYEYDFNHKYYAGKGFDLIERFDRLDVESIEDSLSMSSDFSALSILHDMEALHGGVHSKKNVAAKKIHVNTPPTSTLIKQLTSNPLNSEGNKNIHNFFDNLLQNNETNNKHNNVSNINSDALPIINTKAVHKNKAEGNDDVSVNSDFTATSLIQNLRKSFVSSVNHNDIAASNLNKNSDISDSLKISRNKLVKKTM